MSLWFQKMCVFVSSHWGPLTVFVQQYLWNSLTFKQPSLIAWSGVRVSGNWCPPLWRPGAVKSRWCGPGDRLPGRPRRWRVLMHDGICPSAVSMPCLVFSAREIAGQGIIGFVYGYIKQRFLYTFYFIFGAARISYASLWIMTCNLSSNSSKTSTEIM